MQTNLNPCPLCGERKGYTLHPTDNRRYWMVACAACGNGVGKCLAERIPFSAALPARWVEADAHWQEVSAYAEGMRQRLAEAERKLADIEAAAATDEYYRRSRGLDPT